MRSVGLPCVVSSDFLLGGFCNFVASCTTGSHELTCVCPLVLVFFLPRPRLPLSLPSPPTFQDFVEFREECGDLSILDTRTFVSGMKTGQVCRNRPCFLQHYSRQEESLQEEEVKCLQRPDPCLSILYAPQTVLLREHSNVPLYKDVSPSFCLVILASSCGPCSTPRPTYIPSDANPSRSAEPCTYTVALAPFYSSQEISVEIEHGKVRGPASVGDFLEFCGFCGSVCGCVDRAFPAGWSWKC